MDNRKKRKLTFFTIGLMFLLSGVEYGKIYLFFSLLNVYDSLTSRAMVKKRKHKPSSSLAHLREGQYTNWQDRVNWKGNFSSVIPIHFLRMKLKDNILVFLAYFTRERLN